MRSRLPWPRLIHPVFFAAQMKQPRNCGQKLAWITVVRRPGEPAGTVRLRSGSYFSPIFALSDTPMRVAIPYPAPYESGQGSLSVLGTGGEAVVALSPAWRVSPKMGTAERAVTWHPTGSCARGDG